MGTALFQAHFGRFVERFRTLHTVTGVGNRFEPSRCNCLAARFAFAERAVFEPGEGVSNFRHDELFVREQRGVHIVHELICSHVAEVEGRVGEVASSIATAAAVNLGGNAVGIGPYATSKLLENCAIFLRTEDFADMIATFTSIGR